MIIHGCIKIYPKGCEGWIIVIRFTVLLIMHYLIQEILVEGVLDVYVGLIYIMDNRSWMYRDSPQGLRIMDYCNEVHNFINYALSNSRNISGEILL